LAKPNVVGWLVIARMKQQRLFVADVIPVRTSAALRLQQRE